MAEAGPEAAATQDSQAGADAGGATEPSAGLLQDRPGEFERMWAEARTKGADDDVQIGLDDNARLDPSALPRDKDGKFLKAPKQAAKPKPEGEDPAKPGLKKIEPAEQEATLAEARKLARDGDWEGALRIALGVDITDIDEAQLRSPHFRELRRREAKAKTDVAEAHRQAEVKVSEARRTAQALVPLIHAAQAYQRGDYAAAIKAISQAAGKNHSLEDFLRDIAGNGVQALPRQNDAALAEVQNLRRELAQRDHREAELAQQAKVSEYKAGIGEELGELAEEDARFERLAGKKNFIEAVFSVQERHWRKGRTLPTREAADIAFDELYGDVVQPTSLRTPRAPGATSQAPGANGVSRAQVGSGRAPADRGANGRPRTGPALSHTTSAEAAPTLDMSRYDPETFESNQQKLWNEIERHVMAEARS